MLHVHTPIGALVNYINTVKIYDGENGLKLHEGDGFTGDNIPRYTLSAESGELNLR